MKINIAHEIIEGNGPKVISVTFSQCCWYEIDWIDELLSQLSKSVTIWVDTRDVGESSSMEKDGPFTFKVKIYL